MNRIKIIVLTKGNLTETWGSLTECCTAHKFDYRRLQGYIYPFDYEGWHFVKVPFRALANEG
jgi:hypothetical protein